MRFAIFGILIPVTILASAIGVAYLLYVNKPQPETRNRPVRPPAVNVLKVEKSELLYMVESQGNVRPRTETVLLPQVSGRIVEVSPNFIAGGFFEEGDLLVRIEPEDYEAALASAESNLAQAQLNLATEKAQSDQARRDWENLGRGEASELTLRIPQLRRAEAAVRSAEGAVAQARRNLERTEIRAPYMGLVSEKIADVGQFVGPNTQLARIFAVDYAEVRLPIAPRELAYVPIPESFRRMDEEIEGPPVTLRASVGGKERTWTGQIVRSEGTVDPRSRMVFAIARITDPYGHSDPSLEVPLKIGTFVAAEIEGYRVEDAVKLPRYAVRNESTVLLVDEENRLRSRDVDILRLDEDDVYVGGGLNDGDIVCLTLLEYIVEGMEVNPLNLEGRQRGRGPGGPREERSRNMAQRDGGDESAASAEPAEKSS